MTNRLFIALALAGTFVGPAAAQDDLVTDGKNVFRRCAACHRIGPEAKNGVGPSLNGVVGRVAGTGEGYNYSDPMRQAGEGGLVWDDASLSTYLADPKAMMPGTRMAFAGLKSEDDRKAVIAYLATNGGAM